VHFLTKKWQKNVLFSLYARRNFFLKLKIYTLRRTKVLKKSEKKVKKHAKNEKNTKILQKFSHFF